MIELILMSLVLLWVQLMLPGILALMAGSVSTAYLLGARDETPEVSQASQRARRASSNLLETLPAFWVLAVLSILGGSDVLIWAQAWLVLRVVYLLSYLSGTAYLRSLIWIGALICLIGMALPLF